MSFGEASHLQDKPLVGPFAVQMEIYSVPEYDLMPGTIHPAKGESKGFVTIHSDTVKKVSETLADYYLVLAEKPDGLPMEKLKIKLPFEEAQLDLPKLDKKMPII